MANPSLTWLEECQKNRINDCVRELFFSTGLHGYDGNDMQGILQILIQMASRLGIPQQEFYPTPAVVAPIKKKKIITLADIRVIPVYQDRYHAYVTDQDNLESWGFTAQYAQNLLAALLSSRGISFDFTPMRVAIDRIGEMTNERLLHTWHGLYPVEDWTESTPDGITIDDWAQLLYNELSKRGLPSWK